MLPIVVTSFYQKRLNDKKEAQMKAFSNYGTIFLKHLKVLLPEAFEWQEGSANESFFKLWHNFFKKFEGNDS